MIMRFAFIYLGLVLVFGSCSENQKANRELSIYFSLDSLLDQQIKLLSDGNFVLEKEVRMDGKTESQQIHHDTSGWQTELAILRDFDLNEAYNVGAYETDKRKGSVIYRLADQTLDAPVKLFKVVRSEDQLEISGLYVEDKSIYQHQREFLLTLKGGRLNFFEVSGYQKMLLKDTMSFRITGEVITDPSH